MNRACLVMALAAMHIPAVHAIIIHRIDPTDGTGPVADPNVTILTGWDIGIDVRDPDFWVVTDLTATIDVGLLGQYQFAPFQNNLEPPRNPVSDADAFSNFFSTARNYPNSFENPSEPGYTFDLASATRGLIDVTWSGVESADGFGPFVLFRLAITQDAAAPRLTTAPLGPAVVSITGFSRTNLEGDTPFNLTLYQVPEPAMLGLMLLGGALSARRRV